MDERCRVQCRVRCRVRLSVVVYRVQCKVSRVGRGLGRRVQRSLPSPLQKCDMDLHRHGCYLTVTFPALRAQLEREEKIKHPKGDCKWNMTSVSDVVSAVTGCAHFQMLSPEGNKEKENKQLRLSTSMFTE